MGGLKLPSLFPLATRLIKIVMNQLIKPFFYFFTFLFIVQCTTLEEERHPIFFEALRIEIPDVLVNNTDAIEFIKSSEKAINEFSDNIEEMALNGNEILSKNREKLQTADKLKTGKMAVQFVSNSTEMAYVIESYQKYIESAKSNGFTNAQIKSLKWIGKAMRERADKIDNKYKSYFN